MSVFESLYDIDDKVFELINTEMVETGPDKLGLDYRAGYKFFVEENIIAVHIERDRNLQYYGGFEYVDSVYRRVYGDYVFYFGEDDRVRGHLDRYFDDERAEEKEENNG